MAKVEEWKPLGIYLPASMVTALADSLSGVTVLELSGAGSFWEKA